MEINKEMKECDKQNDEVSIVSKETDVLHEPHQQIITQEENVAEKEISSDIKHLENVIEVPCSEHNSKNEPTSENILCEPTLERGTNLAVEINSNTMASASDKITVKDNSNIVENINLPGDLSPRGTIIPTTEVVTDIQSRNIGVEKPTPICDINSVDIIIEEEGDTVSMNYRVVSESSDESSSSDDDDNVVATAKDTENLSDFKDDHDEETENKPGRKQKNIFKTKGEISFEDLPPIEELKIEVPEDLEVKEIGAVANIVGCLVIVQASIDSSPLDMDSILFVEGCKPLGRVFETFGPVVSPLYAVRFNSPEEIVEKEIEIGLVVYYAPTEEAFTQYVFVEELRRQRGSDASWENNNEPPAKFIDYSDDEAERRAKSKARGKAVDIEEGDEPAKVKKTRKARNRNSKWPYGDVETWPPPQSELQPPQSTPSTDIEQKCFQSTQNNPFSIRSHTTRGRQPRSGHQFVSDGHMSCPFPQNNPFSMRGTHNGGRGRTPGSHLGQYQQNIPFNARAQPSRGGTMTSLVAHSGEMNHSSSHQFPQNNPHFRPGNNRMVNPNYRGMSTSENYPRPQFGRPPSLMNRGGNYGHGMNQHTRFEMPHCDQPQQYSSMFPAQGSNNGSGYSNVNSSVPHSSGHVLDKRYINNDGMAPQNTSDWGMMNTGGESICPPNKKYNNDSSTFENTTNWPPF